MSRQRRTRGAALAVACLAATVATPIAGLIGIGILAGGTPQAGTITPAAGAVVPERAAAAYQQFADQCPGLDWTLLAAVGAVESDHGRTSGSALDPDTGGVDPWIFGPPLDGQNGTAALPIGPWVGWWGLTGPWTQAVGPMQFLPDTFDRHAVDGDDDGRSNPHDIDDAAATAATYICAAAGGAVEGPTEVARIYNPGDATYAGLLTTEQLRIHTATEPASATGSGPTVCPVAGEVEFTDTFGAPRSGGRTHQGVDIFAPAGTPVVAPANGLVEHYHNSLGGPSYRLYADDGTYYYGTHLSAYENLGIGRVTAGTVIGYVGNTGNAATTPPHLHWEIHPRGRGSPAVNPTPATDSLCR